MEYRIPGGKPGRDSLSVPVVPPGESNVAGRPDGGLHRGRRFAASRTLGDHVSIRDTRSSVHLTVSEVQVALVLCLNFHLNTAEVPLQGVVRGRIDHALLDA